MLIEDYDSRKSSSDRFIPHRGNTNFDLSYYYIAYKKDDYHEVKNPNWFVNGAKYNHNLNHYRSELWKAMMPSPKKILVFSSPKRKYKSKKEDSQVRQLWPVHPRSKPLLGPPSLILDMPDIDTHISHQVVDWGKMGYIGTIYENEVHLWHPEENVRRLVTNTLRRVQTCMKFDSDGRRLAMAWDSSAIAVWDCNGSKTIDITSCRCLSKRCVVTSMAYTSRNCLITGCSKGRLCSWSPYLICITSIAYAHTNDIISIKLSCNENYLVTSGIDCSVRIWKWPSLEELVEIIFSGTPIKALAWHPWRDSILTIGSNSQSIVWNVSILKSLEYNKHPYNDCLVDCMTFNPISAELVVSYYVNGYEEYGTNIISVLKNSTQIVDEAHFHGGRVPYLLWDATGTKLATASADENLCIWDFFGTSTESEKRYLKLSKKKELSTDMFKNLNIFNSCIR